MINFFLDLTVSLISELIRDIRENPWISLLWGIIFLTLGIWMLVRYVRKVIRSNRTFDFKLCWDVLFSSVAYMLFYAILKFPDSSSLIIKARQISGFFIIVSIMAIVVIFFRFIRRVIIETFKHNIDGDMENEIDFKDAFDSEFLGNPTWISIVALILSLVLNFTNIDISSWGWIIFGKSIGLWMHDAYWVAVICIFLYFIRFFTGFVIIFPINFIILTKRRRKLELLFNKNIDEFHALYERIKPTPKELTLLGSYHYEGRNGCNKDVILAASLFDKAAKKNYATAQSYLALLLITGEGVEKDVKKALELALISSDKGCPLGSKILETAKSNGIVIPM